MKRQNAEALGELFLEHINRYKKLIWKVARAYCSDAEERKDLVQDIILQLWRSFPRYDATLPFSTWTYRVALNVAISHLRKATTRKKVKADYQTNLALFQIADTMVDERLEQLYQFMERLKPIDRALMILALEGCKNKEIAEILGISESNVSSKKQRVKETLSAYFETFKHEEK